jgi:hypothetical protein
MLFLGMGVHFFASLHAGTTCALGEDDIGSDLREEEKQYRQKSAVEDDLAQENPTSRLASDWRLKMEYD